MTHSRAASALNASTYSNNGSLDGGGGLESKRPIPPPQLFPNGIGGGLQTQLPPPQPSSAGVMGSVNGMLYTEIG